MIGHDGMPFLRAAKAQAICIENMAAFALATAKADALPVHVDAQSGIIHVIEGGKVHDADLDSFSEALRSTYEPIAQAMPGYRLPGISLLTVSESNL